MFHAQEEGEEYDGSKRKEGGNYVLDLHTTLEKRKRRKEKLVRRFNQLGQTGTKIEIERETSEGDNLHNQEKVGEGGEKKLPPF